MTDPLSSSGSDVVRLRMAKIRGGVFLDMRGLPMDAHTAGQAWVEQQVRTADDDLTAGLYERFGNAIGRFVDEPPPTAGFRTVINPKIGIMWILAWPWSDAFTDEGWDHVWDHLGR